MSGRGAEDGLAQIVRLGTVLGVLDAKRQSQELTAGLSDPIDLCPIQALQHMRFRCERRAVSKLRGLDIMFVPQPSRQIPDRQTALPGGKAVIGRVGQVVNPVEKIRREVFRQGAAWQGRQDVPRELFCAMRPLPVLTAGRLHRGCGRGRWVGIEQVVIMGEIRRRAVPGRPHGTHTGSEHVAQFLGGQQWFFGRV